MITVDKVSRSFGKKTIFSDLSLSVNAGEVCGLIGLNGVGKTTLLRLIAGLLSPDCGSIKIGNQHVAPSGKFYRSLGIVLDSDGFNGNLTFLDNIRFFARLKRVPHNELKPYLERYWSHLLDKNNPVKQFSRGERMQCALARAFIGRPRVLLLDEPASNLDHEGNRLLYQLVREFHENETAVIISSHRFDTISELCQSVAFLSSHGLKKVSLTEEIDRCWVMRGINLSDSLSLLTSAGADVLAINDQEIRFKGINRDQLSSLIPSIVAKGTKIWELFIRDPLEAALELLNDL